MVENDKGPLPSAEDLRKFCAEHAFKIGETFPDTRLEEWIRMGSWSAKSQQIEFRSPRRRSNWILAFAARECCEASADGPDRIGFPARSIKAPIFSQMMRRLS